MSASQAPTGYSIEDGDEDHRAAFDDEFDHRVPSVHRSTAPDTAYCTGGCAASFNFCIE